MYSTPKPPNNALSRLWRSLIGVFPKFDGSARSRAYTWNKSETTAVGRDYDLEIQEIPVRDRIRARTLIEMREYSPEIAFAVETIFSDVLSSADGDDQGFAIAQELSNGTAVNPGVRKILEECRERIFTRSLLEMIGDRLLNFGDCFVNRAVDLNLRQVSGLVVLPTWEVFRVEIDGQLEYFEQRRSLWGADPIRLEPITISHFRYRRQNLYGRALFEESRSDWQELTTAIQNLARAGREIGYNPTIHVMPQGYSVAQKEQYKQEHTAALKASNGLISHYYTLFGGDIHKLSNSHPDLKALSDVVAMFRTRIAMRSHLPFHLFGIQTGSAREISQQPALAYARFINSIRAVMTESLTEIFRLELALKGIDPRDPANAFRLVWPKIYIDPTQSQSGLSDETAETDDTESKATQGIERMYLESV